MFNTYGFCMHCCFITHLHYSSIAVQMNMTYNHLDTAYTAGNSCTGFTMGATVKGAFWN